MPNSGEDHRSGSAPWRSGRAVGFAPVIADRVIAARVGDLGDSETRPPRRSSSLEPKLVRGSVWAHTVWAHSVTHEAATSSTVWLGSWW